VREVTRQLECESAQPQTLQNEFHTPDDASHAQSTGAGWPAETVTLPGDLQPA
jgi:hypothetical protein